MSENKYTNIMDDWQVRLIKSRARRVGFNSQDCEDVSQQIAMETVAFSFDPERSNGAAPEAALATIVKRQVQCAARRRSRYCKRLERFKESQRAVPTGVEPTHEMQLDVRMAAEQLPPELQRVCAMLAEGESIAGIAEALNCGWHTVERMIGRIRERFEKMGLNEWLGG